MAHLMLLWVEVVVTVTPQLDTRLVWAEEQELRLWRLLRADRLRLTGELELSLDRLMCRPHGELRRLPLLWAWAPARGDAEGGREVWWQARSQGGARATCVLWLIKQPKNMDRQKGVLFVCFLCSSSLTPQ